MEHAGRDGAAGSPRPKGAEAFVVTPFARLARAHSVLVGGDALVALALAGSLFFSISPDAARVRVALYLAFTMAPFALIAPLIGPAIDRARGGRRMMVVLTGATRAIVAFLMIRNLDGLLLFPLAFTALVAQKAYQVAKSALVPALVRRSDDLVQANSRLALLSGIAGAVAFIPGGVLMALGGADWVMGLAAVAFTAGTVVSLQLPRVSVAPEPADDTERAELRGVGIIAAASGMGLLRGIVGFVVFLLAFHLRSIDAHTVWFGVLVAASTVGNLAGAMLAPLLRRAVREEVVLLGVLIGVSGVAALVAVFGGLGGATMLSVGVGLAAGAGKMAFDAIVQRDAPDANQGRSFARFETRFQLVWVAGALIPVVLPFDVLSVRVGYVVIAVVAGFAGFTYVAALRAIARGQRPEPVRLPVKVRTPPWVERARRRVSDAARRPGRRPASEADPGGPDGGTDLGGQHRPADP